jgi:hypothetical protein
MLIYHPLYDLNHGVFRTLALLERTPKKSLAFDAFRILDFYLLFPHLLAGVPLPSKMLRMKRQLEGRQSKFNRVPSERGLLQQMLGAHHAVTSSLAAKGFLDVDALRAGTLLRTSQPLPEALLSEIEQQPKDELELLDFLAMDVAAIGPLGKDGLKARTGLLEHRYDPV